jgi:hypothetical protein
VRGDPSYLLDACQAVGRAANNEKFDAKTKTAVVVAGDRPGHDEDAATRSE